MTWSWSWLTTKRCPSSRRSSPTSPPSPRNWLVIHNFSWEFYSTHKVIIYMGDSNETLIIVLPLTIYFFQNYSTQKLIYYTILYFWKVKPRQMAHVLSCVLFQRTIIEFVRNLVPEIVTTKGITNLFSLLCACCQKLINKRSVLGTIPYPLTTRQHL